ncbi:hypothetical protein Tco_1186784, partial [Tanacetum coccineum]
TQREAQQANELSNLTRQRQLLASVNNRRAIIEEIELCREISWPVRQRSTSSVFRRLFLLRRLT